MEFPSQAEIRIPTYDGDGPLSPEFLETARTVSFWSSVTTATIYSCVVTGIFLSGYYLRLGSTECAPLLVFIFVFETFKWIYASTLFYEDIYCNPKRSSKLHVAQTALSHNYEAQNFFKGLVVLGASIVFFYFIAVFYGAEILGEFEGNFIFSTIISLLIVYPICLHLGPDKMPLIAVEVKKPKNLLQYLLYTNFFCTLLGAWFGAMVIPLDWDRPWQVWPVPCNFGALLGFTIAHLISLFHVSTESLNFGSRKDH